ncbi:MAG: hypothetical protein Kow0029_06680 [Candidatus Rifleibacteriota bacterium]
MDQARWIVVLSVVFCMMATLTILTKLFPKQPVLDSNDELNVETLPLYSRNEVRKNSTKKQKGNWKPPEKIKYSKPPSHVFEVESGEAFAAENKEFEDRGKIVQ